MKTKDQSVETSELGLDWSASEYIHHHKDARWFLVMTLVMAALAAVTYFLSGRSLLAPVSVCLLALCLVIFALKRPQEHRYSLQAEGLLVADKLYPYDDFIHFTVFEDSEQLAVQLTPTKRWLVPLTVYVPVDVADGVIDHLRQVVAYEDKDQSLIDRFTHFIRF